MIRTRLFALVLTASPLFVACSESKETAAPAATTSTLPESFYLAAEPAGAKDVLVAKTDLKDGDTVVVRGRVQDFVNGLAAFVLTDGALKSCDEEGPMPTCDTPWDYCCTDPAEVAAASAGIEFRNGDKVLRTDAKGFHGLDHLKWVTVKGVAKLDTQGNVTVVADGVYVKP